MQRRKKRIPHIRVQMDNTCRENKNRYVLGFCHWLVAMGICDTLELCFLPVGHTHERVDQVFSRVSHSLGKTMAYTVDHFLTIVEEAFTPKPNVEALVGTLDFSKWLTPYFQRHIQDVTSPHR